MVKRNDIAVLGDYNYGSLGFVGTIIKYFKYNLYGCKL